MASDTDIEQTKEIASLKTDLDLLRGEVKRYKDKEHEQFEERIRKLEKWVWGCSAVLGVVVTLGGILPKVMSFPSPQENRRYIEQVILPSYGINDNWRNQYHDEWVRKGGFKD